MSAVATTSPNNTKQRESRTTLPASRKPNFATLLNDLSNEKTREAAQKAEDTLFALETNEKETLTVVHYASVINSWANIGDAARAEAILDHMLERADNEDDTISNALLPNSHCFSGVMKAVINSSTTASSSRPQHESISQRCEDLMSKMNDLSREHFNEHIKPNTVVYNTLLNAYAEEVTALFLQRRMNDRKYPFPNVLKANMNIPVAGDEAYKLLVHKSVAVLQKMENSSDADTPKPDAYTYCTVISLLAKCEDLESAELAETYLSKVSKKFDTPTYNSVISAWAQTGTVEGAKRANSLLVQLEEAITGVEGCRTLPNDYGPNSISYHTVISAWVRSCSVGDGGRAAEKAEEILSRMESKLESSSFSEEERMHRFLPNVIAYSSTIDCWSKSGSADAAMHAKRLIDRMEQLGIEPNVFTYTSALTAYARSDSEEGASEASALLTHMKKKYYETGDENLKPTVVTYFAAIDCWARSNTAKAGMEAAALLKEMEDLYQEGDTQIRPDVRVYARVIAAFAKSTQKGSDNRAIALLRSMEKFALSGDETGALAKPNVVCYNTLISAYASRGNAKQAFSILNQMDQFSSRISDENDKVIADEHSLNGIIYALSKSSLRGKARKALKTLERLENSHIDGNWRAKPSSRSYNMVIAACSNSFKADEKEKAQALTIALDVFSRLRTSPHVETDRYTYISLLKTCGKLLPTTSKRRRKLVENVFRECCSEGLVDDSVLSNFLVAAPKELSESILGEVQLNNPRAKTLPTEWTRKVIPQ